MNGWLFLLTLLALAALIVAVLRFRRVHHRQELLKERIRHSEAFTCVRPLMERCRTLRVESIVFRPDAVVVKLFDPPGKKLKCVFEEHGLDEAEPEPLMALALAAAEELPMLGDNRKYFFKAYREEAGGDVLRWYEYMIQPAYKDSVLRARYDRIEV